MTNKILLLYLTFLCQSNLYIYAQKSKTYSVSGIVKEAVSGETLPGVIVSCDSLRIAVLSNNYGFYTIALPKGVHQVSFGFLGYKKNKQIIVLNENKRLDIELEQGIEIKEIEITADEKKSVSEDSRMSTISIPIQAIKDIPALLGEKDVLKVIQLLPGVQKGSEGSSGLYVRGGGPDQNMIILDDALVYNAYHLFGFFSLFNGDALKSVELVKGGFPARYGGRLSSVLEMQMKEGNMNKIKGEAGIGIVASRFMIEGPILKNKVSFLVSGRRTYIDALIYPFLPKESRGGYFFYDFNAKLNWKINDKNRIYLSSYIGKDRFYFSNKVDDFESSGRLQWGNRTVTARWNHIYGQKLFSNTSFIVSDYLLQISNKEKFLQDSYNLSFNSGISDLSLKHDVDFFPYNNHHLKFGIQSIAHQFSPSAVVFTQNQTPGLKVGVKTIPTYESGIYAEDDWKINGIFKTNIGLRLAHYNLRSSNFLRLEPRISARAMLNENTSIKAAYAEMNQFIHLLSSTGVSLPTDLWLPATDKVKPMNSKQVALGIAKDLPKDISVTIEGYYKSMSNVSFYKEGSSFLLIDNPEGAENISWESNITQGRGWSYGAEFLLQKSKGKYTGWIGYTLSWIWFQFDSVNFGKKFHPRYDRRHDFSFVNIYKLKENITLSLTWIYGTGNAITLPLSTYDPAPHYPSQIEGYQTMNNFFQNNFRSDYGEKNSFRMAPYHRMDAGVQFHKKKKFFHRTIELSVYNLYNRWNPFFYFIERNENNLSELKQVTLFPIIPSVSYSIKF